MFRLCHLLLALACLAVLVAARAHAQEEVFVLDNGTTFRGEVVRANDEDVEVRLSGFGRNASVTLARARIVTRFVPVDARTLPEAVRLPDADWAAQSTPPDDREASPTAAAPEPTPDVGPEEAVPTTTDVPEVEPALRDEGFFHRLARVAALSLPPSAAGRIALAGLLFVALLMLVMLGCRLAEIENLGLGRSAVLATVLGLFLGADVLLHDPLLRADVATWVLPVQAALWLAVAVPTLRCGLARSILLFAFVMFSLAVLLFTAGAILVTY